MTNEFKSDYMTVTKREDNLFDISTETGYIGAVMESQLEKAEQILKRDKWGRRFYTLLNN